MSNPMLSAAIYETVLNEFLRLKDFKVRAPNPSFVIFLNLKLKIKVFKLFFVVDFQ